MHHNRWQHFRARKHHYSVPSNRVLVKLMQSFGNNWIFFSLFFSVSFSSSRNLVKLMNYPIYWHRKSWYEWENAGNSLCRNCDCVVAAKMHRAPQQLHQNQLIIIYESFIMASMFDAQLHQLPHNCSHQLSSSGQYASTFPFINRFSLWFLAFRFDLLLCDFVAFEFPRFISTFYKHLSFCASTFCWRWVFVRFK